MKSKQKLNQSSEYTIPKEDTYFGNEFQSSIEFNNDSVEYFENQIIQKQNKNKKRDYTKLIRKMGYLVASTVAVVTLAQSTSDSQAPKIPNDAIVFDEHYYKLYDEQFTWEEAQVKCKELGGYLVIISYEEEQKFIEKINSNPRWIGSDVPFETKERGNFITRGEGVNGYICEWD